MRYLFVQQNLISNDEVDKLYIDLDSYNPYELRTVALEERISNKNLARILLHIAKRRGFKSNRKSELEEKDIGILLKSIIENTNLMEKDKLTPGQYLNSLDVKRNKRGAYTNTLLRESLKAEAEKILTTQMELGNDKITIDFIRKYLDILLSQRNFASPGDIEKLTGKCTFEKKELRAPSAAYTSELFMALTKINSLKIIGSTGETTISKSNVSEIVNDAFLKKKVTYASIRKRLKMADSESFNFLDYGNKNKKGELSSRDDVEKSTFIELKHYHKLKDTIKDNLGESRWFDISQNHLMLDVIAYGLTFRKSDDDIRNYLSGTESGEYSPPCIVPVDIIDAVLKLSFSRTKNLSFIAMQKMIPYLFEGLRYDEAALAAGYHHSVVSKNEKFRLLPVFDMDEVRNPVVFRALSQTRKVINSIIREYGSPFNINIELARDLSKPFIERREIEKKQKDNQADKERASDHFKELYHQLPKSSDLLKWRLFREQEEKCAYSLKSIDPYRLIEPGYVDIDHILPYSRTFDNSYNNKVLVLSDENRNKLNRTPFEYLGSNQQHWYRFESWVETSKLNREKKQRLLRKELSRSQTADLKERALNDTRYISRYIKNYIENYLLFADGEKKKRVNTFKGSMTAYLRHRWGFSAKVRDNDLHHALDAIIVAVMNDAMVKIIEKTSKKQEFYNKKVNGEYIDPETGEIIDSQYVNIKSTILDVPWVEFKDEVDLRLSINPQYLVKYKKYNTYTHEELDAIKPIFISRMPFRKISGPAHMETIRGIKQLENGIKTIRLPLSGVKLKDLENMVGKNSDPLTYNLIKARLELFEDKPELAYSKPLYKLKKDGSDGPEIKSIKIGSSFSAGVSINDETGIADNGSMIRIDVFQKNGKHYVIPVYVHHRANGILPDKIIVPGKPFKDWKQLDESYDFLFSLYKNDLVKLIFKNDIEIFGYFNSLDSSIANIRIENHLNHNVVDRKGIMSAIRVEKWCVDVLGNLSRVKKEKRLELEKPRNCKQS